MLKNTLLLISIMLVSTAIIFSAYVLKDKELCCGIEICRNLTSICEETDIDGDAVLTSSKGTELRIFDLKSGDTVTNGSEIRGEVKGSWYFEGTFPIVILDLKGNLITSTFATAQGEWTTDAQVPFLFVLDVPIIQEDDVVIVFQKSNPSGLVVNDDSVSIPVKITASNEQMEVKVFFPNSNMGSTEDCSEVFAVTRSVPRVSAVARVSMEQLIIGPTQSEIENGYFSNINEDVEIQSLSIANGVADIDLSSELEEGIGGSCMVESIRAQIEETLKQFPTVNDVELSIDGREDDILQP